MLKHNAYSFKHTAFAHTVCGGSRSGVLLEDLLPHILSVPLYSVELVSLISHNDAMTSSGITVEKNIPHV
jgi:hypothetical protein